MAPPRVARAIGIARMENRTLSPAAEAFLDAVRRQAKVDIEN
jgi:hypothetical protein